MEKINSLNPIDPAWPNDIWFDEKSKEGIKHLFREVGPSKETKRYISQQLQLQSKCVKYNRSIWIKYSKIFIPHKDTLIYYHADLKGESQEYDI